MGATVEITEEDGEYTAVDPATGATGSGNTRSMALAMLAANLRAEEDEGWEDGGGELELLARAALTRRRFDRADVTDEDVEDAIAWARSESS